MRLTAFAALSALIIFPAEAAQRHGSLATACDNDGHCTMHQLTTTATPRHSRQRAHRMTGVTPVATGVATTVTTEVATATETVQKQSGALDANGNAIGLVVSRKTGARTRVGVAYAARFQAYIDDLENNHGARVLFMGGLRPGRCSIYSEHPCGKALDVCQLRRGVVDRRCNLPGRIALGQIAAAHGLFEGGRWCDSDYGHAQVGVTAPACSDRGVSVVRQER
jgi:hypothetical protein